MGKMFGDVTKDTGLKALDKHLADNSYIEGYVPSQADTAVFDALKGKTPDRSTYPHAERWFLHIKNNSLKAQNQPIPTSVAQPQPPKKTTTKMSIFSVPMMRKKMKKLPRLENKDWLHMPRKSQ